MKCSPLKAGFAQAIGLLFYINLVAWFFERAPRFFGSGAPPVLAASLFLLFFVISALISSSLILGYPLLLFLENRKKEALAVAGWSLFFMVALFAGLAALVPVLSSAF